MGAERWDEQVGSVADEAGRLLESLRQAAAEAARASASAAEETSSGPTATGSADDGSADDGGAAGGRAHGGGARPASGPGRGPDDEHEHDPLNGGAAPHDPVCQWCPICRGAAVVRSLSPETLARLADLAGVAASVLADLASARSAADPAAPAPPRRPAPATSRPIPVRDADDPQEAPRG